MQLTHDFFDASSFYTCQPLTDGLVLAAQERLGRRLPEAYLQLLRLRNGGKPKRRCFQAKFRTSWAEDHFEIEAILGIGEPRGIDSAGPFSSSALISEWGYPNIGLVICAMPSGGHDAVMLDYRDGHGEPTVAYVDEDRSARTVARSFQDFIDRLVDCRDTAK